MHSDRWFPLRCADARRFLLRLFSIFHEKKCVCIECTYLGHNFNISGRHDSQIEFIVFVGFYCCFCCCCCFYSRTMSMHTNNKPIILSQTQFRLSFTSMRFGLFQRRNKKWIRPELYTQTFDDGGGCGNLSTHTHIDPRKENFKQNKMIWHIQFDAKTEHKRRKQLIRRMKHQIIQTN